MKSDGRFVIKAAQSEAEIKSAFRLRYQVFGDEEDSLDPNTHPDGLEYDDYDRRPRITTSFIALIDDLCIGTVRITFDSPYGFALEKHLDVVGKQMVNSWRSAGQTIAEGSRFAITKDYRSENHIAKALMKVCVMCALSHKVEHFIGCVNNGTCKAQGRLGVFESFGFKAIAPAFFFDEFKEYAQPVYLKLPGGISRSFLDYLKVDHPFLPKEYAALSAW